VIQNGIIRATSSGYASGIGNGQSLRTGISMTDKITTFDRNITAIIQGTNARGPSLGTSEAFSKSISVIDTILILNGNINAISRDESGIGSGHTHTHGTAKIQKIRVLNGNISASCSHLAKVLEVDVQEGHRIQRLKPLHY
jgi:hypothetical protein